MRQWGWGAKKPTYQYKRESLAKVYQACPLPVWTDTQIRAALLEHGWQAKRQFGWWWIMAGDRRLTKRRRLGDALSFCLKYKTTAKAA